MKYFNCSLLLTCIIIGFQNNVNAQPKMQSSVISNGCKPVYGNNIQINGTLGQPIIGIVNNSKNTGYFGFWYVYQQTTITDIEDEETIPTVFKLEQNYPNPFNPSTKIKFAVPEKSNVQIKIYDILGNEIAILVDEYKQAGSYDIKFDASQLSSGIYFYRLKTGSFVETKKMILLR